MIPNFMFVRVSVRKTNNSSRYCPKKYYQRSDLFFGIILSNLCEKNVSDYHKMEARILMGVMDWNAVPKHVTNEYEQ